ncbi:putative unusual protein kinase [Mycobacteroides abscessus subsp. abscessus]|nr:putative unusual protein kinase [Mycobacteroides abscessus subsp. abscessus]
MRRSFAELGPAYVKFGQLIASSPGMFPEDLSAEFRSLLDQVPPADPQTIRSMVTNELGASPENVFGSFDEVPFASPGMFPEDLSAEFRSLLDQVPPADPQTIRSMLSNELGASPENVFGSFDEVPFASASIAQVHRATLKDGTAVVVKIQRPAIRTRLAADLQILKQIARGLELTEMGRMSNIYEVMRDFESNLAEELDFSLEARAMRDWTAGLAGSRYASKVRVPEIYSDLCTNKVLTMEYVEGIRIDDADAIRAAGFDGPEVVKTLMLTLFDSAFTAGTFHGDLHAGNLMVDPHGRIVFLDFGIVGRLDQRTRKTLRELIGALILEPDDEAAARTLIKLGAIDAHADPARVAESLRKVTRPMGTSLGKISYGTIGRQLTALGREHDANLAEELDFSLEARAMRDWTAGLAGSRYASKVRVPEIYSDLCTNKVLTMEYVEGIRIDDADAIRAAGFDGPEVVKTLMLTLFDSAFTAGTFHGDLHAGNLMVDPHGRIVFLDFGIVGRLDQRTRKTLRELIGALILEPDDEAAARTLIELGAIDAHADPARVAESLRKVTRPMGTSLGKISYGTIGRQLTALGREHDAILPKEFILVGKQLLYVERYTKLLAPDWQPVGDPEILTYFGTLIAEYQQAREEIKHSKDDTDGLGE